MSDFAKGLVDAIADVLQPHLGSLSPAEQGVVMGDTAIAALAYLRSLEVAQRMQIMDMESMTLDPLQPFKTTTGTVYWCDGADTRVWRPKDPLWLHDDEEPERTPDVEHRA